MAKETAMSAALGKAGLRKEEFEFYAHAMRYLKSGGTIETGIKVLTRAAEEIERDHTASASQGHESPSAFAPGAGQPSTIREDHTRRASARPSQDGDQHFSAQSSQPTGVAAAVGKARQTVLPKATSPLPPGRHPTPAQRAARRFAGGHTAPVPGIFARKLSDGCPIGEVTTDQIKRRVAHNLVEASFFMRLKARGLPEVPQRIDEYFPAEFVKKAWEDAQKADVVSVVDEGILLSPDGKLSFVRREVANEQLSN